MLVSKCSAWIIESLARSCASEATFEIELVPGGPPEAIVLNPNPSRILLESLNVILIETTRYHPRYRELPCRLKLFAVLVSCGRIGRVT
jgi:hypothetical protein